MASYKDILNTFGGDTSYADRFQAAAQQWDTAAMSSIIKEYRWGTTQTPTQTYTPQQTYTPTQTTNQYNQWNGNLGNWNYQDDSNDRQEQIVSNLNQAYAQNPDQFKDWATFSQNFNYDTAWRSDKQKETMRNWYSQMQGNQLDYNNVNNTDYFFNQFMQWNVLEWKWTALDSARTRYNNWKYLSWMQPTQIASAIAWWSISAVGQEMQDLKQYSPALYAQVQAQLQWQTTVDDINSLWQGIYNWLTWTETNWNYTKYDMSSDYVKNASLIQQYNSDLYKKIESLWWDTAAYVAIVASMLQNPNIQSAKNEVEELEWEVNKIQEQMYTIWDTVRTTLWSEAPEDLVSAYISQQTKQLQNQLRTTQNSLLVAQGKLDNQLTEVDLMLDAINNWIKIYGEWWTASSWNNYQYISWSKYQDAWYFDKSTGQFYKLWETPDTRDYQTSDPARLQEIRDNLDNIANSDNAYVFRDRSAFNDYFKYSQRWAAQKKVLDDFWNANAARLKPIADQKYQQYLKSQSSKKWSGWSGSWSGSWWTNDNDKWQRLKKAIINWDVAWWYSKTSMKKYWFATELNEEEVVTKMAQICTPDEYDKLYANLWVTARNKFKSEIQTRIKNSITSNADTIKTRMKDAWYSLWNKKREAEAETLAKELWINFGTLWKSAIISYYKSL